MSLWWLAVSACTSICRGLASVLLEHLRFAGGGRHSSVVEPRPTRTTAISAYSPRPTRVVVSRNRRNQASGFRYGLYEIRRNQCLSVSHRAIAGFSRSPGHFAFVFSIRLAGRRRGLCRTFSASAAENLRMISP